MSAAEIRIDGLSERAEILVDTWGVPHIYAHNAPDVFLAQGFVAARDRLFQMDLWRRRGLGRLSAVFGEEHAEQDAANRLFLYRGDTRAEWLSYASDTKEIVTSFVAGINAFIALCGTSPDLMPAEFTALGYQPELWDPLDIVKIRTHGLFHNVEQEVARFSTIQEFGGDAENLRRVRDPFGPINMPEPLHDLDLPDDLLRLYRLALGPAGLGALRQPRGPEGSNNWVLGPSRTATGRPILANDPHRAVTVPALRYVTHLSCPEFDVVGGGEPVLPGVAIGHNGTMAFGMTIFPIDQEDLYVYDLHPDDQTLYRYAGGWERMTVLVETVEIAGGAPREFELRFTRHGPIIHSDDSRAYAVRAAWLEPGMAPYLGSVDYMRATTPAAFHSAMNRWGSPGENQVYASTDGHIGWRPGGLIPRRESWDGLVPVPGDGSHEWNGFHDNDLLPRSVDPECDWVASANEFNLPEGFTETGSVGSDWYASTRADRLRTVLSAATGWTVDDCVALQNDSVSPLRATLDPVISGLTANTTMGERAAQLLREWDGDVRADSAAAVVFEVWVREHFAPALLRAALRRTVPEDRLDDAVARLTPSEIYSGDPRIAVALATGAMTSGAPLPAATVQQLADASLEAAVVWLSIRLGPDPAAWQWGDVHFTLLEHGASALLPADFPGTTLGPLPRSGSGDTIASTAYDSSFRQASGASFRVVIDVGEWDNSLFRNSPGQSGMQSSRHYSDQFDDWDSGRMLPLLYSREAVESHCASRVILTPPS